MIALAHGGAHDSPERRRGCAAAGRILLSHLTRLTAYRFIYSDTRDAWIRCYGLSRLCAAREDQYRSIIHERVSSCVVCVISRSNDCGWLVRILPRLSSNTFPRSRRPTYRTSIRPLAMTFSHRLLSWGATRLLQVRGLSSALFIFATDFLQSPTFNSALLRTPCNPARRTPARTR